MSELNKTEKVDFEKTLGYIFQQAIICERKNRNLYVQFSKMFAHIPEISSFWIELAKDEELHARALEDIQSSLENEQFSRNADEELLTSIKCISSYSDAISFDQIKTLDDAYELAHDIESSEINNVFKILTSEFISEQTRKKAIYSELKYHVDKLMDFNKTFGDKTWRKGITSKQLVTT
ncbi:MAG: hypothetical protein JXA96_14960 [Sedimentisphaerales bacterium]|nr:hypothetical protein [Sedimentisphaerales bacterium]